MKKTLIASAVAAATLSTGAFAAEGLEFYGDIEAFASYTSSDIGGTNGNGLANSDADSTLGLMHTSAVSEGVKAFAKVEFDYSLNYGGLALDEAYFGVEGDFGKVWAGNDDSLYENVDIIDFSNGLRSAAGNNVGEGLDPWGDLARVNEAATIKYLNSNVAEGVTIGVEVQTVDNNGDLGVLYVGYAADALSVDFAYALAHGTKEDTVGVAATFAVSDELSVGGQFETQSDHGSIFGAIANYSMGATSIAAMASMYTEDGIGADTTTLGLGAYHNVSDNIQLFVELAGNDVDNNGTNQEMVVGGSYSF